jgi:hypothetical protein
MNDKAFFDTNVLVSIVGQDDERTAPAEALVAGGGVVSVARFPVDARLDGRTFVKFTRG